MVPLISNTSLDDVVGVSRPVTRSCPAAPLVAIVVIPVPSEFPIVVLPLPEVLTFTVPVTDVVDDALPIVVLDVPVVLMLVPPVMVVTPAIAFVAEALPMVVVALPEVLTFVGPVIAVVEEALPMFVPRAPVTLTFVRPVIEPPELPVIRPVTASEPPTVALPVTPNVPVTSRVFEPLVEPMKTKPLLAMRMRSTLFVRMARGVALFDPRNSVVGVARVLPVRDQP